MMDEKTDNKKKNRREIEKEGDMDDVPMRCENERQRHRRREKQ